MVLRSTVRDVTVRSDGIVSLTEMSATVIGPAFETVIVGRRRPGTKCGPWSQTVRSAPVVSVSDAALSAGLRPAFSIRRRRR